jgi:hypothetical protein
MKIIYKALNYVVGCIPISLLSFYYNTFSHSITDEKNSGNGSRQRVGSNHHGNWNTRQGADIAFLRLFCWFDGRGSS